MKSPMLKLDLLIPADKTEELSLSLQEIGLLHLENLGKGKSLNGDSRWKKFAETKAWIDSQNIEPIYSKLEDDQDLLTYIDELRARASRINHQKDELERALEFWKVWGSFNQEPWLALQSKGLHLGLFEGSTKNWLAHQDIGFMINQQDNRIYFCLIGSQEFLQSLRLDEVSIPSMDLQGATELQLELRKAEEDLHREIAICKTQMHELEQEEQKIAEVWDFEQGLDLWKDVEETEFQSLRAWISENHLEKFKEATSNLAIAYRISKPEKTDKVPIELRNTKFSKLFEPITKIFQLPHYFEFDLTPLIAVFYPILFAYCLGDAGYGAIMTLAAVIAWFSFLKSNRSIAALIGVLGLSTTIMGLIKSGSLFGVALQVNSAVPLISKLGELVIIPDDNSFFFNAFNVALLIGVFQILIGILIAIAKAWYYEGFKASISHWGKLMIVISSVSLFMAETLGLSANGLSFFQILLLLGILSIMFFHDLSQGLFARIGSSILPLFFIFTGLLGDVLSYVRLFALGVTSAVLGLVVNQIGMGMVSENWWSWIGAGAFLLFGHGLNFVLAALGSFIHPLRLTFVEFYNNAQFEGGGLVFRPFKRSKPLN